LSLVLAQDSVSSGALLSFKIAAFNLGRLSRYDLKFIYEIVDKDGKIINKIEESAAIETSLSLSREIQVPDKTKSGDYFLDVTAVYDELKASAKAAFKVKGIALPNWFKEYFPIIIGLLVVIFVLIVFGYYIFSIKKKLEEKELERIKKNSQYVFPDFKLLPKSTYAYLGKVADTPVKTYLDHTQLNRHTLVAGGTGAGKTVAGMLISEELLRRDVPVIVFDPVGQWGGFFEKNSSKEMLSKYRKFGMGSPKAFGGRVIEVGIPEMKMDILPYLNKRGITILQLTKLPPKKVDEFIYLCLKRIYSANLAETSYLKSLLVIDEVHRLLPKYGGKKAHVKLEQAVREFRKWGIGLLMISQVLTDFKGAIRGNIGTEIQLMSRYEGDIKRVRERHGSKVSKLISKLPVGLGMVEASGYNRGNPYFVEFRPLYHSQFKPTKILDKWKEKVNDFVAPEKQERRERHKEKKVHISKHKISHAKHNKARSKKKKTSAKKHAAKKAAKSGKHEK